MSKKTKIIYESEDENCQQKIKQLKTVLKKIKKERDDYLAGWQRAKADLINMQTRFEKEKAEVLSWANFDLIKATLPVLDSLDEAYNFVGTRRRLVPTGMKKIREQLLDILADFGLSEIKIKKGDKLDSDLCEVVAAEKDGDKISEIIQKGYLLDGKVVRAVKVKVG